MIKQPLPLRLADKLEGVADANVNIFSTRIALRKSAEELRRLHAENEELKKDAMRYRALCSSGAYAPSSSFRSAPWGLVTGNTQPQSKAVLDAAVDACIATQAKQGGV